MPADDPRVGDAQETGSGEGSEGTVEVIRVVRRRRPACVPKAQADADDPPPKNYQRGVG